MNAISEAAATQRATMAKISIISALILALACVVLGIPTPDEERYLDKEYTRELIGWLASLNPSSSSNPCRYYTTGNYMVPMPKRNSELINSLLSLPKSMNDAGRK